MSFLKRPDASMPATRSCSGCYAIIAPDWRVCRVCGTVLIAGTTHETREDCRPIPTATVLGALNLPIRSTGRGR
jgi:hypothetical protein